jgi:16S rRNA (guanine527-N7)-methyltransferase
METGLRDLLVGGAGTLGVHLTDEAVGRFSTYLDLLQTWGARINLTSRLEAQDIVVYHFLDSLSGAQWLVGSPGVRVIDIGTGAGMPAIPLKIVRPDLEVIMIDGTRKKALFCQEAIKELGLTGAEALWGRAEELGRKPEHRGRYRWAVCRAVGQSSEIASLALPFLDDKGALLLYKGNPEQKELDALAALCRRKHAVMENHPAEVPHLVGARTHLIVKRIA